jgi:hypothetical protein
MSNNRACFHKRLHDALNIAWPVPIGEESTDTASRLMRRPIAGGSAEMVLEEPHAVGWGYLCPPKPGGGCVLGVFEGKDLVY